MSHTDAWAEAIDFEHDLEGGPTLGTVLKHVRTAIFEMGFVTRSRIVNGLNEAYRPFEVSRDIVRSRVEEALSQLVLLGEVDRYQTAAGQSYAATPPRVIDWGGGLLAVLGSAPDALDSDVRRVERDYAHKLAIPKISLNEELGRADWRTALVSLGGSDALDIGPQEIFRYASILAASGERFAADRPADTAVLSGSGDFFGRAERAPDGRWRRIETDGTFPGRTRTAYAWRDIVVRIEDGEATLWSAPDRDCWNWIVLGATLQQGDPVMRYDELSRTLTFLTPPPRQLERAVRLAGEQLGPWRWQVDPLVVSTLKSLLSLPQTSS